MEFHDKYLGLPVLIKKLKKETFFVYERSSLEEITKLAWWFVELCRSGVASENYGTSFAHVIYAMFYFSQIFL